MPCTFSSFSLAVPSPEAPCHLEEPMTLDLEPAVQRSSPSRVQTAIMGRPVPECHSMGMMFLEPRILLVDDSSRLGVGWSRGPDGCCLSTHSQQGQPFLSLSRLRQTY